MTVDSAPLPQIDAGKVADSKVADSNADQAPPPPPDSETRLSELKVLAPASGLIPAFSPEITSYAANTGILTTTVQIIASPMHPSATASIDGVPLLAGVPLTVELGKAQGIDREISLSVLVRAPSGSKSSTSITVRSNIDYIKSANTGAYDDFGGSVAIHGDTLVVGASSEQSAATGINGDGTNNAANRSGAAYVFVWNGQAWLQQAYLKASNAEEEDSFGTSVAVYGDTVVVGASSEQSAATGIDGDQKDNSANASGAAYVFERVGSTWAQAAYLKASNSHDNAQFGTSVAIYSDAIVVGAPTERGLASGVNGDPSILGGDDSGAAYVFRRTGSSWFQEAYIKAEPNTPNVNFGRNVAVSADTIVASAILGGSKKAGMVHVYSLQGANWKPQTTLEPTDPSSVKQFGKSVAIEGNTIVVGAPSDRPTITGRWGDTKGPMNSGTAYVFSRQTGLWGLATILSASNFDSNDYFGTTVAISGETIVVGAPWEGGYFAGVNGDENVGELQYSGAGYVFSRESPASWVQTTYLKASNPETRDNFGSRVAISAGIIVVTSPNEDSGALLVNGDPWNNTATNSGAVYAY
jgi:trimeric autotransporter adhesin